MRTHRSTGSYVRAESDGRITVFCIHCEWSRAYRPIVGRVSFVQMLEDDRQHYADLHGSQPRQGADHAA